MDLEDSILHRVMEQNTPDLNSIQRERWQARTGQN